MSEQMQLQAQKEQNHQMPNHTNIPTQMKLDFEKRSGLSFDDVRVHYHSDKPARIGALAYTQGNQVYIGPGQERHLRHELGHVVQQKQGLVRPDRESTFGIPINTDPVLEHQADLLGNETLSSDRTAYIPQPHLARSSGEPVVQAKHVFASIAELKQHFGSDACPENISELADSSQTTTEEASTSGQAEKPTMVYESMGVDERAFSQILLETKKYDGNTLLVFGLNMKCSDDGNKISSNFLENYERFKEEYDRIASANARMGSNQGSSGPRIHSAYCFPFWWKQPQLARAYLMPFIEARGLIMRKAQEYISLHEQFFSSKPTLFRWIDGDARNDQMNLAAGALNQFAQLDAPYIVTGAYHWYSNRPSNDTHYLDFIEQLNAAECELRDYFYRLKCAQNVKELNKRYSFTLPDQNSDNYYFPETAFIMNTAAHDCLARVHVNDPDEKGQDQESMRMVKQANCKFGIIPAIHKFTVDKPIKNEGADKSYLGKELQEIVNKEKKCTFQKFCVALKNLRQSVFDNGHWHFINNSDAGRWENPTGIIEATEPTDEWKQSMLNQKRYETANKLAECKFLSNTIR